MSKIEKLKNIVIEERNKLLKSGDAFPTLCVSKGVSFSIGNFKRLHYLLVSFGEEMEKQFPKLDFSDNNLCSYIIRTPGVGRGSLNLLKYLEKKMENV
mgnify:CR=1